MGIGIITSFAAREVFVSTMSTVYNVGSEEETAEKTQLVETLREQKRDDGTPVYTALTAVSLMVFYVFAMQCVSTWRLCIGKPTPGNGRSSSGFIWASWRGPGIPDVPRRPPFGLG